MFLTTSPRDKEPFGFPVGRVWADGIIFWENIPPVRQPRRGWHDSSPGWTCNYRICICTYLSVYIRYIIFILYTYIYIFYILYMYIYLIYVYTCMCVFAIYLDFYEHPIPTFIHIVQAADRKRFRSRHWTSAAKKVVGSEDTLTADESCLSELSLGSTWPNGEV